MKELITKLRYHHDLWNVFSDFVEMTAISISNAVDLKNKDIREKRYLDINSKYSKEEAALFVQMVVDLVNELEMNPRDVLGELFMDLNLENKWTGQVFTPLSIAKACGEMMSRDVQEKLKTTSYVTISEPAAGSGSMVIGLALAMRDQKINYQNKILVTAVDVDIRAVHMCYVQLSLLGIPAIVVHGNTLTLDMYSEWITPMYLLGNWNVKQRNFKE